MIRRLIAVAFLCLGLFCLAQAQVPITGAGQGSIFQSTGFGPGGYTGPGDLGLTFVEWTGFRCYSTNYVGPIAIITDSATGDTTATKLQCASGGVISAATGANCAGPGVSGNTCSPLATTCATACNVYELFDQSGNTNCTTACNRIQATNADRPTFTTSGCTGLSGSQTWCITGNGTGNVVLSTTNKFEGSTVSQPYSLYSACKVNSPTSDQGCTSNSNINFVGINGSDHPEVYCGSANGSVTASDANTWLALQATCNGASSVIYANGSSLGTPGTNPGTTNMTAGAGFGFVALDTGFGNGCTCNFVEAGTFTASAASSTLNSNVRNFWGF